MPKGKPAAGTAWGAFCGSGLEARPTTPRRAGDRGSRTAWKVRETSPLQGHRTGDARATPDRAFRQACRLGCRATALVRGASGRLLPPLREGRRVLHGPVHGVAEGFLAHARLCQQALDCFWLLLGCHPAPPLPPCGSPHPRPPACDTPRHAGQHPVGLHHRPVRCTNGGASVPGGVTNRSETTRTTPATGEPACPPTTRAIKTHWIAPTCPSRVANVDRPRRALYERASHLRTHDLVATRSRRSRGKPCVSPSSPEHRVGWEPRLR